MRVGGFAEDVLVLQSPGRARRAMPEFPVTAPAAQVSRPCTQGGYPSLRRGVSAHAPRFSQHLEPWATTTPQLIVGVGGVRGVHEDSLVLPAWLFQDVPSVYQQLQGGVCADGTRCCLISLNPPPRSQAMHHGGSSGCFAYIAAPRVSCEREGIAPLDTLGKQ